MLITRAPATASGDLFRHAALDAISPSLLRSTVDRHSNFRNPHYHLPTDTPETLSYEAMADVTRMIVGHVLQQD